MATAPAYLTGDLLKEPDRLLFDSGYTDKELDGIFTSLAKDADLDWLECFTSALVIGLCDGDILTFAEPGTVMLRTPRAEIDGRIAAVRAGMMEGATFQEAVCALPGE